MAGQGGSSGQGHTIVLYAGPSPMKGMSSICTSTSVSHVYIKRCLSASVEYEWKQGRRQHVTVSWASGMRGGGLEQRIETDIKDINE